MGFGQEPFASAPLATSSPSLIGPVEIQQGSGAQHRVDVQNLAGQKGIYLELELTVGKFFLPESSFPPLRGATDAQKISNLENDLHSILDSLTGSQRIRLRISSLSPLTYMFSVFADAAAMERV